MCVYIYSYRVHIRTPVVGTESLLHPVEEYMRHVDDYYRTLELGGDRGTRRIYLASERKGVFAEVKKKYFEIIVIIIIIVRRRYVRFCGRTE